MIYQAFFTRLDNGAQLLSNVRFPYIGKCRIKIIHLTAFTNQVAGQNQLLLMTSSQIISKQPILLGGSSPTSGVAGLPFFVGNYGDEYVYEDVDLKGELNLRIGWFTGDVFTPATATGSSYAILTFDIEYMDDKNK